ncbi:hypothetical protein [Exiguobacterium sp. SRB7LM]|uniref:hypothetical protein n=1 Tax=Exiguobacterium sp. SRB7LM TaxID=2608401 RepID=UPI0018C3D048|nr:hypothetical protein [Exiguobacterium sp. SRB7LM]MBG0916996.1 hypothetical protein [Exiguobacterium sp. SRB7LM]
MEQLLTLPDVTIHYVSSIGDWTTEREESVENIVWVLVLGGKSGLRWMYSNIVSKTANRL